MKTFKIVGLLLLCVFCIAVYSQADDHGKDVEIKQFAELPSGVMFPEGITANARGEIIVGTFNIMGNNKLLRFDKKGRLLAMKDFGPTALLGLQYNSADDKIYICNFGIPEILSAEIQRIAADFTANTQVESVATVPMIGPPTDRIVGNFGGYPDTISFGFQIQAPNAITFAQNGELYFSDSFQGAIFTIANPAECAGDCSVEPLVHDPLLATAGVPPFGANGLALSNDEQFLFVANTGDDRILKVDLGTKAVTVFTESVDGADGMIMDRSGRLLVAANQADELVAINENGRVVAKYGNTAALKNSATKKGLLFPASLVMVGKNVYVTNLAFPITQTVFGDEPEDEVLVYRISKIRLH